MSKKLDLDMTKRLEAMLSLLRREEPAERIARRYGISDSTLYRLRDQFLEGGKQALADGRGRADGQDRLLQGLEPQLAARDRVIGEPSIANRILNMGRKAGAERWTA